MTVTLSLDRQRTGRPGRLRQFATVLRATSAAVVTRAFTPARPAFANLAKIPLTATGVALIDFAAFHVTHSLGWLVTGVSLFLVEHLIADER